MGKLIDLTNQRFGRLVVISRGGVKYRSAAWKCICDCGAVKVIDGQYLRSRRVLSCGCYNRGLTIERNINKALPSGESAFNKLYSNYQNYHSKNRNLEFNLSKDEFREIITKNCFYCGAPPSQVYKNRKGATPFTYNGPDRVNNLKGYTKDNCVPACGSCNQKKCAITFDMIRLISNHPSYLSWIIGSPKN